MTTTPDNIPTPAQDALRAEETTLSAEMARQREAFRTAFEARTKDVLVALFIDKDQRIHAMPKGNAPKSAWVKVLTDLEVKETVAFKRLRELRKAADREEEIVRRAFAAATVEDVQAAFPTEMAKTIAERGWKKDEVLDLALSITVREIKAQCWGNVRLLMTQNHTPGEALASVRQHSQETIVARAGWGFQSSSMTSNLVEQATTKGYVAFLDDLKYL